MISVSPVNRLTVNWSGVMDVQQIAGIARCGCKHDHAHRDTNENRIVNSSDIGQTKAQSGLPVTAANFRRDLTANGAITSSDVGS